MERSVLPLRTETLGDARAFVLYWDKIERLRREAGSAEDVLLSPLHFLTVTDGTRRSCSVACWDKDELVGLLYAVEQSVGGARTGYAVGGDYAGRGLLVCQAGLQAAVITASIAHMASHGIHSMHLRLLPGDTLKPVLRGIRVRCLDGLIAGDRMQLAPEFDEFLGTLGKRTRRNMRNFMRKVTQASIEFAPSLTRQEYQTGVHRLNKTTPFRADPLRLTRDERVLSLHSGAQRYGLRQPDGSLVAVLCGFTQGKRFHLLTQLNDAHLEHLSLSLVLRGHVIAHLIASGHTELQFVGGASLSLGRFCAAQQYRSIFADRETGMAALLKRLACRLMSVLDRFGKRVPETLKMLCNGHLEDRELAERTALAPAAFLFPEGKRI